MDKPPPAELGKTGKIITGTVLAVIVVPPVIIGTIKFCVWLWSL